MGCIDRIRRVAVWLARCGHCRGFGIQSPRAYSFVRYVVNEHDKYYAYETLSAASAGLRATERRLLEFYFRLANYLQPGTVACCGRVGILFADYVKAGCRRAEVLSIGTEEGSIAALEALECIDMAVLSPGLALSRQWETALTKAASTSAFVIEGIHSAPEARTLWRRVLSDSRTGITFDLYYCGVVFFDKQLFKQNYIINF